MADMITYTTAVLRSVAEILATPPLFYLFGLVCSVFVVKIIMDLVRFR